MSVQHTVLSKDGKGAKLDSQQLWKKKPFPSFLLFKNHHCFTLEFAMILNLFGTVSRGDSPNEYPSRTLVKSLTISPTHPFPSPPSSQERNRKKHPPPSVKVERRL